MKKILITFCFLVSSLAAQIDFSVIPAISTLEKRQQIVPHKYSKSQYQEIQSALDHIAEKTRIVTFNMLFDIKDHKLDPENRWPQRLPRIVESLDNMQPDIFCIQELQANQLQQLKEKLDDQYTFFFDANATELDGIFFRTERFSLIDGQTWIIPNKKKKTILTMVHLSDNNTDNDLFVFNAHFPFCNPDDRENTAIEIAKILFPYAETEAVILAGDMNTFANRPDLLQVPFYDGDRIEALLTRGKIQDSYKKSLLGHVGPISTFTNQDPGIHGFEGFGTPGIILDHLFVSDYLEVLIHAHESAQIDGHFPSDHIPVLIDVIHKINRSSD